MDQQKKKEMGKRIRAWREKRGYTREQLSGLSALFAPIHRQHRIRGYQHQPGHPYRSVPGPLLQQRQHLFGGEVQPEGWAEEIACLQNLPVKYQPEISRMLQSVTELILAAEPKRK